LAFRWRNRGLSQTASDCRPSVFSGLRSWNNLDQNSETAEIPKSVETTIQREEILTRNILSDMKRFVRLIDWLNDENNLVTFLLNQVKILELFMRIGDSFRDDHLDVWSNFSRLERRWLTLRAKKQSIKTTNDYSPGLKIDKLGQYLTSAIYQSSGGRS